MQNLIKLSAAVHELSCEQKNKTRTRTIQPVATARTLINIQDQYKTAISQRDVHAVTEAHCVACPSGQEENTATLVCRINTQRRDLITAIKANDDDDTTRRNAGYEQQTQTVHS